MLNSNLPNHAETVSKENFLTIILDAAHGSNVSGKRSPDGQFLEYEFSRDVIRRIQNLFGEMNFKYTIVETVEGELEPGLLHRVRVANRQLMPAVFISVHANAAGSDGKWHSARGFEIYTSLGKTKADHLARCIFEKFVEAFPDFKTRADYSDNDPDKEANFYVLRNTKMPAVLIETGFQDNKEDVGLMTSPDFKDKFAKSIISAVAAYVEDKLPEITLNS